MNHKLYLRSKYRTPLFNKSVPLKIAILLVFLFGTSIPFQNSAVARAKTPIEILMTHPVWKDLPAAFLNAMSDKLGSVEITQDFVAFSQENVILQDNILKIAREQPVSALGRVAQALTSYANSLGGMGEFTDAQRALKMALLIRPKALNAMIGMALAGMGQNDCETARDFADKVLTSKPNPQSDDPLEVEEAGKWKHLEKISKGIKDMCRGKR